MSERISSAPEISEIPVDHLFDIEARQAHKDFENYLATRPTYDEATTLASGHKGVSQDSRSADNYFDDKRMRHQEETIGREYEQMSTTELAKKMGEAIHFDDLTTAKNVWDVLSAKVDKMVTDAKSEKDIEHNSLREAQIRERITRIVNKRIEELDGETGTSAETATESKEVNVTDSDDDPSKNTDTNGMTPETENNSEPNLSGGEAKQSSDDEASNSGEDTVDNVNSDQPDDMQNPPESNDPAKPEDTLEEDSKAVKLEDDKSQDTDTQNTSDRITHTELKNEPFNVMRHFKQQAQKNQTTFNTTYGIGVNRDTEKLSHSSKQAKDIGMRAVAWAKQKFTPDKPEAEQQVDTQTSSHNESTIDNQPTKEINSEHNRDRSRYMVDLLEHIQTEMGIDVTNLTAQNRINLLHQLLEVNGVKNSLELQKREKSDVVYPDEATVRHILDK